MADSFTHLHVHTEFSMLDGAARVSEVVAKAAADGQPAIGITDHGNMYGILDFYQECKKQEIGCVIGTELYMAYDHRTERPPRRGKMDDSGGDAEGGRKAYYHLTALAENNVGYKNLIQLSSRAYMEGYYMKPRCLLAGQEIVTATGVKNIEDVEVGDLVFTHRGRLRPVTQVMSRHHRGEVYGVVLNNRYGRVTWMTGEHPVLVHGQDGVNRWVEVQDIDAGRRTTRQEMSSWKSFACLPKPRTEASRSTIRTADFVGDGWRWDGSTFVKETMRRARGATRHYSFLEETVALDYEFGFFVGLFAAEGHTHTNGSVTISIHEEEVDLAEAFRLMAKKLTHKEAVVRRRVDRPDYRGVDIQVCSSPLASFMRQMCGVGASNKHLPSFTYDAPREFQQGLLDGVLAGDGADYGTHNTLCQTSRDLAWHVRMLAASLNDSFAAVRTGWDGHPKHAPTHVVNISATSGLAHRRVLFDDSYVYRPIADIEKKDYDGLVYNIEVAEDHSYVSDFAIHNCDWEMLSDHAEGIIATTGCLGGQVLQELLRDDYRAAVEKAARLQDIFGRDNLFVEIQDHEIPEQKRTNPLLYKIAKQIKAPLLATNDSHYTHQGDAVSHDALLCVQTGSLMSDPDRFKFHGDQHFLKSAAEMRSLFTEVPEACDNTLWIAERAQVEIEFGKPQLPNFPIPEGFVDDAAYLEHLTFEGARKRWGNDLPDAVVERLAFELKVIGDMGFSSYFLIVWDLIKHARDKNIRVGPGRGSAAGCAVAYTLWITDLDPIKYDLLFERFLNPSRISMPDIDMDFDSRYRDEMIRYAAEMYGRDHVAQIVTFSTIKARAAVRDAARVLGYPYAVGDKVAKAMPPLVMGRDTPLAACLEQQPKYEDGYKMAADLRAMYETDPDAKAVIDVARGLEGLRRQDGIHAAAVVITKESLTEYLPIQRKPEAGKPIEEAPVVTQYEMHGVEDLGLLKMDFLGLRNLDVISDTVDMIKEVRGVDLDIDNVDLEDEPTYELLRKGDSIGVFQLEGGAMRTLMRSLAPTGFEDVAALVALYRPGPMAANMHNDYADRKNGRKSIEYLHPDAEEILGSTQGLMIYQESMMRIAQKFAGFSLADADNLRKACGKKNRALIQKEREKFTAGCEATGYGAALGTAWFDIIEPFADYAFNKSHSYGYGFVAYQTAYLKANYPVEYFAALLTSVKTNLDKAAIYLNECRQMGIPVLVPDVNRSMSDFVSARDENGNEVIPFGLSAVRNVGEGLVELMVSERDANGPFTDFYDFCDRVDIAVLNKRTIESLVKAGGFDSMGHPRQGLLRVYEQIIDRCVARRRKEAEGQFDLFSSLDTADTGLPAEPRIEIPNDEFDKKQRLAFEKEMLGLYVSDHPLMGAEASLRKRAECTIAELEGVEDGSLRTIGGLVTNLQRKWTKKGDLMAVFILEDLQSSIEVMVFPKTMQSHGHLLEDDAVVIIKGRVDTRDDQPKLMVMELERFEPITDGNAPLRINMTPNAMSESILSALKELLLEHPGESQVFLHLGATQVLRLPDEFLVDPTTGLVAELRVLLGPDAVVI